MARGVSLPLPCIVPSRPIPAVFGTGPGREDVVAQTLHLPGVFLCTRIWMFLPVLEGYLTGSHLPSPLLGAHIHRASQWAGCVTTSERDPKTEKDLAANLTDVNCRLKQRS